MGMPVVEAPCEAEAQCAELAKAGLVYGAASEDMDTLTFGTPRLIRKMFATAESKIPVLEFDHKKILDGFEMTNDQFIDVCILAGCDYCDTIKGVAATTAFKLIKQHGSLEEVLKNVDKEKIPKDVDYDEVRKLFVTPEVIEASKVELKWGDPDREGLIQFLVAERQFNPERIQKGIDKLFKARAGGQQTRMDAFFKPVPVDPSSSKKRKNEEPAPKKVKSEKKQKK